MVYFSGLKYPLRDVCMCKSYRNKSLCELIERVQ